MPGSGASGGWRSHAERISDKSDNTVISAPSTGKIQIASLHVSVETDPGNGDELIRLEDGAGGTQIFALLASDGPDGLDYGERAPFELSDETLLNSETTGTGTGVYIVNVRYRVVG